MSIEILSSIAQLSLREEDRIILGQLESLPEHMQRREWIANLPPQAMVEGEPMPCAWDEFNAKLIAEGHRICHVTAELREVGSPQPDQDDRRIRLTAMFGIPSMRFYKWWGVTLMWQITDRENDVFSGMAVWRQKQLAQPRPESEPEGGEG